MINDLSLYSTVFCVPESSGITLSETSSSPQKALQAALVLHALTNHNVAASSLSGLAFPSLPPVHPLLLTELTAPTKPLRRLYLAAALTPYHGSTYMQGKGKVRPAAEAVIREGLKLGAQYHYLDGIPVLFAGADLLQKGVSDWETGAMDKPERAWIGAWARLLPSTGAVVPDLRCRQACSCATRMCTTLW